MGKSNSGILLNVFYKPTFKNYRTLKEFVTLDLFTVCGMGELNEFMIQFT